jgi:hypothetical protein
MFPGRQRGKKEEKEKKRKKEFSMLTLKRSE